MKVVILAGGLGTRISEETVDKPKPMIEVGGKPILWHIMKIYSSFGFHDFVICLGYRGYVIKEYFANYFLHQSDVTFDMRHNEMKVHHKRSEPWNVTLVDTGQNSGTGGRLRRIREYLGDEDFCFTYGDGVSDVDVSKLVDFHRQQNCLVTLTAIQPPSKYGVLAINDNKVTRFQEKPNDGGWINGGFFVVSPKAIDYISTDETHWEHDPLTSIARAGELSAYHHAGFWQSMDTLRDRNLLEDLWSSSAPPWKVWR